jgi:serine/threonine protein kinase/uncharacterized caspase-like protein
MAERRTVSTLDEIARLLPVGTLMDSRKSLDSAQVSATAAVADGNASSPPQTGGLPETVGPGGASSVDMHTRTQTPPGLPLAQAAHPGNLPPEFGRYQIVKKLGEGGMGAVYLAHDSQLDRSVALKVPHFLPHDDSHAVERFYREARAAAGLHHANLCPVYDVGERQGTHYLTMAYIEGVSLAEWLDRQMDDPPPLTKAVDLVRQMASALAYAHRRGVVHRDLKPSNVMLTAGGVPVIMDFGLARRAQEKGDRLTRSGDIMGTPAYMPPEQVRGELAKIGPASDVYSLGMIFYQLLAGRLPFEGSIAEILVQVLTQQPAPPSVHHPGVDPKLSVICLSAIAAKTEDRYQSMDEFETALSAYLQEKEGDVTVPDIQRSDSPIAVHRHWPLVFAALTVSVVLSVALLIAAPYWNAGHAKAPPGPSAGSGAGGSSPPTEGPLKRGKPPEAGPNPAPSEEKLEDYALLIGVDRYDDFRAIGREKNLQFADRDAAELAQTLREGGYRPENVVVMTSGETGHPQFAPRAANIRTQLRNMARSQPRPRSMLIAFSGYEVQVPDSHEYFLCPSDANRGDKTSMISLQEIYGELEQCAAESTLLIVDSCRDLETGGARDPGSPRAKQPHLPPDNMAVLFACSRGEFALEPAELKHGLLSYYVIQGLRSDADLSGDGKVTQTELLSFLRRSVPQYAEQKLKIPQTPEVLGETLDRVVTQTNGVSSGSQ